MKGKKESISISYVCSYGSRNNSSGNGRGER